MATNGGTEGDQVEKGSKATRIDVRERLHTQEGRPWPESRTSWNLGLEGEGKPQGAGILTDGND